MTYVAVVGSRSFTDYAQLSRVLDRCRTRWGDFVLVSGGARGADSLAARWARERGLPEPLLFFPNYPRYGRRAPLERNREIVAAAEVVVAFWDGASRGTADTMRWAAAAGKRVYWKGRG